MSSRRALRAPDHFVAVAHAGQMAEAARNDVQHRIGQLGVQPDAMRIARLRGAHPAALEYASILLVQTRQPLTRS